MMIHISIDMSHIIHYGISYKHREEGEVVNDLEAKADFCLG
jgi:hypothetical protein